MKIPLFRQQMAKEWYFLLAKHCLEEFKLDCQLRRLTERTIKGYYNNTLNFLIYVEKHHGISEVDEILTLHIRHYVQYLLSKKLAIDRFAGLQQEPQHLLIIRFIRLRGQMPPVKTVVKKNGITFVLLFHEQF